MSKTTTAYCGLLKLRTNKGLTQVHYFNLSLVQRLCLSVLISPTSASPKPYNIFMQPIFSRNVDVTKIAFLNWRIDNGGDIRNILNLAEGYLDASIALAKNCLTDNEDKKADIIIFPILTNANHGIELYLKALNWILNRLINSEKKIEGGHNIKQIFQLVRSKIKIYKGKISLKEFNSATKELEQYIIELFDKIEATPKDDKMDFSRYPFSNEYDNHFYVETIGNVEIDLENFVSRFEIIKERLETMSGFLYYQELNQEW